VELGWVPPEIIPQRRPSMEFMASRCTEFLEMDRAHSSCYRHLCLAA
jgi:hypothetical protein